MHYRMISLGLMLLITQAMSLAYQNGLVTDGQPLSPGGPVITPLDAVCDTTTQKLPLNAGESKDWSIQLKRDETLIVVVSAPVKTKILLLDPQGKEVATNHQPKVGDPTYRFVYTAQDPGNYTIQVYNLSSDKKGDYLVKWGRFQSVPSNLESPIIGKVSPYFMGWVRVRVAKDQLFSIAGMAETTTGLTAIVDPTGNIKPLNSKATDIVTNKKVVRAYVPGDYFICFAGSNANKEFGARVLNVKRETIAIGQEMKNQKLGDGEFAYWRIKVSAGDLIRVKAQSSDNGLNFDVQPINNPTNVAEDEREKPWQEIVSIIQSPKIFDTKTYIATKSGEVDIRLGSYGSGPCTYTLKVDRPERAFPKDKVVKSRLGIGEMQFWKYDGAPGKLQQILAQTKDFDLSYIVIDPSGVAVEQSELSLINQQVNIGDKPWNDKPRYLAVYCSGFGGSGQYSIQRRDYPVKQFTQAQMAKGIVAPAQGLIVSFDAKAGDELKLTLKDQELPVPTILNSGDTWIGNDAWILSSDRKSATVKIPKDGVYTFRMFNSVTYIEKYELKLTRL